MNVSVPTIYRAIRCGILPRSLTKQCLRYHGKDYKRIGEEKRGKLSGCTSIDLRPPEASNRRRTGDIEGDTIVGRQGTGIIVTLVDRKTRYLAAAKLEHKGADGVAKAVTGLLSNIPCQSVTFDNGKEFACHRQMSEELGVPIYFAHPHSPWERGTNENTNKLLRQFLPKGSSFANVTDSMLSKFVNMLNNRPRKCLGYATPAEMMFSKQNVAFGLTI